MRRSLGGDHPVGRRTSGRRSSARGTAQKQFGPKINPPRLIEIVEVAQTDTAAAEANSHQPFAVPPIPRDTGKGVLAST